MELNELTRSTSDLFLAGLSAGLDIGFNLLFIAVMTTLVEGQFAEPVVALLVANMYAVGFIFVILGRSELFTEQTTLAVLPVLTGRASLGSLTRLWTVVYVANLIGGAIFAWLATTLGPALGVIEPWVFGKIAREVVEDGWWVIILSGVVAGWLMGLLAWLVTAARDTISQIFFIWLIATGIGFGHLHHSITGTVEVLSGIFGAQGITLADVGHFLLWTTLGNAVGGVLFAVVIKSSLAIRGRDRTSEVQPE